MTTQSRHPAKQRRADILTAALRIASDKGYNCITRDDIALAAKCSPALVSSYFGTMPSLRRTLMREAVRAQCLPVVAQGLTLRDRFALAAPEELRATAIASLER